MTYDPRTNTQGPRSPGEALMMQQDLKKLSDDELVELIGRLDHSNDALNLAMGALADIAMSDDMDLQIARNKARRIYEICLKLRG